MNEQGLMDELAKADAEHLEAKRKLAVAKRLCTHAETQVIETALNKERMAEKLRAFRARSMNRPLTLLQMEIEKFREDYPDLVEFARLRDAEKAKRNK